MEQVEYAVRGMLPGFMPGVHHGIFLGSGGRFEGYTTLLHRPDARRIDPVATRRAGSKVPLVRTYRAKISATVVVLVDLSASMAFGEKVREAAKLVACLGYSAGALGDRFAVVGYSDRLELLIVGIPARAGAIEASAALWQHTPQGKGLALEEACAVMPRRRALVFWVSDFHLEPHAIEQALAILHRHDVILVEPVHPAETQPASRWGWSRLRDPETGETRGVWIRPGLLRKLADHQARQQEGLANLARRFGGEVLRIEQVDPEALTHFFLERRASA